MLFLVTAAEMQYRLESEVRDRDLERIAMIRERRDALAAEAALAAAPASTTPRQARARTAWARPIGVPAATACAQPAC